MHISDERISFKMDTTTEAADDDSSDDVFESKGKSKLGLQLGISSEDVNDYINNL